jgi:hypothetical protein
MNTANNLLVRLSSPVGSDLSSTRKMRGSARGLEIALAQDRELVRDVPGGNERKRAHRFEGAA